MGNAEITVTDCTASKTVIVIYFSKTGVHLCIVCCKMCLIFSFLGYSPSAMVLLFLDTLDCLIRFGRRDKSPPTLKIDWLTYRNRPIRMLHEAHTHTATHTHSLMDEYSNLSRHTSRL